MLVYFAYGSNLNKEQMRARCPAAQPVARFIFPGKRLLFRGVADIINEEGAECPGGLWLITPRCEQALDIYEGWRPNNEGMYRKEYVELPESCMGAKRLMYYAMNSTGIFPPSQGYLATIREGYRNFKLPQRYLREAVMHSYDDKAPSHIERRRRMRTGRPPLAPRPLRIV